MNLNVMREATDRPDNEVFNYTSLFDTEKNSSRVQVKISS